MPFFASSILITFAGCGPRRTGSALSTQACLVGGVAYAGGGAAGKDVNVSWFCSNSDRFYVIAAGSREVEVRVVPGGCPECPSAETRGVP
jgi:hypothetical protein